MNKTTQIPLEDITRETAHKFAGARLDYLTDNMPLRAEESDRYFEKYLHITYNDMAVINYWIEYYLSITGRGNDNAIQ